MRAGTSILRPSEVRTKRGWAARWVCPALATTHLRQLQLSRVVHWQSLKRRAGWPLSALSKAASARSASISATSQMLRARPNRQLTRLCSHHAIKASRAKPELARNTIFTSGQCLRICPTMRSTSSRAPAAPSMFERRSFEASSWRP